MSSMTTTKPAGDEEGSDDASRAGGCGRWQGWVYAALGVVYMRGVWPVFAPIFFNYDPGHQCAVPDDVTWNTSWLPEGETEWSQCSTYVTVSHGNATQPCPLGWHFRHEGLESSIVTEWGLVCGRAWEGELATTLYMVGSALGTLLTPLADRLGRRLFLLGCQAVQGLAGLGLFWSNGLVVFIVVRFLIGVTNMATALSTYILVTESMPRTWRTLPAVGLSVLWAVGIMLLSLLAFLLPQWRHLQLAISLPCFASILLLWPVPESIPWLLSRRRTRQAQNIVEQILKVNGLDFTRSNMTAVAASLGGNLDNAEVTENRKTSLQPSIIHLSMKGVVESQCPSLDSESVRNSEEAPNGQTKQAEPETPDHHKSTVSRRTATTDRGQSTSDHVLSAVKANEVFESQRSSPDVTVSPATLPKAEKSVAMEATAKETPKKVADATAKDLLANPRMRLYTAVVCFLYLVNSLGYFGISLSTPSLHGDRFLNLMLSGAVEIPAYLLCGFCTHRVGRRRPICAFLTICAVMNIATAFIPETTGDGTDLGWLKTTLVMVGKFGVSGSYSALYLFGAEIFPTAIRNQAVGFASFFENVGNVAAPLTVYAARRLWLVPVVTYGVATGVGAVLVLLLPETNQRALPATVAEITAWGKVGSRVKLQVASPSKADIASSAAASNTAEKDGGSHTKRDTFATHL